MADWICFSRRYDRVLSQPVIANCFASEGEMKTLASYRLHFSIKFCMFCLSGRLIWFRFAYLLINLIKCWQFPDASEDRISAQILLFEQTFRSSALYVKKSLASFWNLHKFFLPACSAFWVKYWLSWGFVALYTVSCHAEKLFWVIGQATRTKKLSEETLAKSHSHQTDAESSLRNRKFSLEAEVVVAVAAGDVAFERMARKINWRRTIKEGETCKTGFLFHSLVMYYYLSCDWNPKFYNDETFRNAADDESLIWDEVCGGSCIGQVLCHCQPGLGKLLVVVKKN